MSNEQKKDWPWWTSSNGLIEFQFPPDLVDFICKPGPNDAMVASAVDDPRLRPILDKIDPDLIVKDLREYGAWSDDDLKDREQNLHRLVWLAAWNIHDDEFANSN